MCKGVNNTTYNSIYKLEIPSYLCRKSSDVLHDTSKTKFTRPETGKPR